MNNYDSNLFNKEEEHNNVLLNLQEHSNKKMIKNQDANML